MNSNYILIENFTQSDFKSKQIRITVDNKHLFPEEIIGNPITHKLIFMFEENKYKVPYTIGSKDGKSRSGVLKFNNELNFDILNIKHGDILKISYVGQNKYLIEKK